MLLITILYLLPPLLNGCSLFYPLHVHLQLLSLHWTAPSLHLLLLPLRLLHLLLPLLVVPPLILKVMLEPPHLNDLVYLLRELSPPRDVLARYAHPREPVVVGLDPVVDVVQH